MESQIIEEILNVVGTNPPADSDLNTFIKADEEYKQLIKEGLTTKRGFNIMTTGEIYSSAVSNIYSQSTGFGN